MLLSISKHLKPPVSTIPLRRLSFSLFRTWYTSPPDQNELHRRGKYPGRRHSPGIQAYIRSKGYSQAAEGTIKKTPLSKLTAVPQSPNRYKGHYPRSVQSKRFKSGLESICKNLSSSPTISYQNDHQIQRYNQSIPRRIKKKEYAEEQNSIPQPAVTPQPLPQHYSPSLLTLRQISALEPSLVKNADG